MTPHQFGEFFVTSTTPNADMLIQILFSSEGPGQALPLARSVLVDPLPARLHIIAMLVAANFIYPMKVLNVPSSVMQDIMLGVTSELLKLRHPDGKSLNPEDVKSANNMISAFYDLIAEDLAKRESVEAESPHTQPPKATQLLLSSIVMHYNNGGATGKAAVEKLVHQGYYSSAYAAATKMIDGAPIVPLNALKELNVTLKVA